MKTEINFYVSFFFFLLSFFKLFFFIPCFIGLDFVDAIGINDRSKEGQNVKILCFTSLVVKDGS
jgi:hypothetical protein